MNLIIDKHDPDPEENKTTQRLILPAFRVIYLAAKTGLASTNERPTADRARSGIRTETTTERGLPPSIRRSGGRGDGPLARPSAASPHACLPFLGRNRSLGRTAQPRSRRGAISTPARPPSHRRKADHTKSKKSIAGERREVKRSRAANANEFRWHSFTSVHFRKHVALSRPPRLPSPRREASEGPNRLRRMYEGGTKDVCTKDVSPLHSKVGPMNCLWFFLHEPWFLVAIEPRSII